MENEIGFIARLIGGVIALVGAAFGFGKFNASIVKKKELYNPDGSPIYLTMEQSYKEIAGVNSRLDKINQYLVKKNDDDLKLMRTIGRVEQYMEGRKK